MDILLDGYFDRNYGDDLMQEIIVSSFPKCNFYINCPMREMVLHFEKYNNVYINKNKNSYDLYLYIIGTGFLYNSKRAKISKLFEIINKKKINCKKSALINCSLEDIKGTVSKALVNYDLKKFSYISCRDIDTFNYIKNNINKNVCCYPDISFCKSNLLSNNPRDFLGVSVVNRLYSKDNYIYFKKISDICDTYIEKYNKKVLLFAFDSGMENDVSAVLSIKNMMKNKDMAELIIYDKSTSLVPYNMDRCKWFLGSRFHSIIEAIKLNLKVISIYDNKKTKDISLKYNIPCFSKNEFSKEEIFNEFLNYKGIDFNNDNEKSHIDFIREKIIQGD